MRKYKAAEQFVPQSQEQANLLQQNSSKIEEQNSYFSTPRNVDITSTQDKLTGKKRQISVLQSPIKSNVFYEPNSSSSNSQFETSTIPPVASTPFFWSAPNSVLQSPNPTAKKKSKLDDETSRPSSAYTKPTALTTPRMSSKPNTTTTTPISNTTTSMLQHNNTTSMTRDGLINEKVKENQMFENLLVQICVLHDMVEKSFHYQEINAMNQIFAVWNLIQEKRKQVLSNQQKYYQQQVHSVVQQVMGEQMPALEKVVQQLSMFQQMYQELSTVLNEATEKVELKGVKLKANQSVEQEMTLLLQQSDQILRKVEQMLSSHYRYISEFQTTIASLQQVIQGLEHTKQKTEQNIVEIQQLKSHEDSLTIQMLQSQNKAMF